VVVRPGEVLSGLGRRLGDVALDARIRDEDEDRQEQAVGLGRLEQRPPSLKPQPDGSEEAGRPVLGEDGVVLGAHEQRRVARWRLGQDLRDRAVAVDVAAAAAT
jgi:hypothetical protein